METGAIALADADAERGVQANMLFRPMSTTQTSPPRREQIAVPQVAVAQLGARNHYATPIVLARHGMLARFYTDIYAGSRWRAMLRMASKVLPRAGSKRLLARFTPDLPADAIIAFTAFGADYQWRCLRARSEREQLRAFLWAGRRFCELVLQHGLGQATAVYGFSSAALELLQEARRHGRLGILDHAIFPILFDRRQMAEQQRRYAAWSPERPQEPDEPTRAYAQRQREECNAADLIICISNYVRAAIASEGGPAEKTLVIPLGVPSQFFAGLAKPKRAGALRVLLVGNDAVRKGLPDLVHAVRLLASSQVQVRAVGSMRMTRYGTQEASRTVELWGPVSRPEMAEHYAWADVFVLPTVGDTFAQVILEAMAAGVPAIVTPCSGGPDVIRDAVDGFLVPINAPEAIAAKLDLLAGDRERLHAMSENARQRAREFTFERLGERLVSAIRDAHHAVAAHVEGKVTAR
jgi:glycosyltransferase involved in cell wall biosynthesis